ncbi:MAG TPA: copper homeostasis protein CutC [Lentimicrobium sp.]|nr:copper homeostasis protein CutC [Lentimicrobium sp.]
MDNRILIEVCVDNAESALSAQKGGAHRLELCSALSEGGLSPSKGLMEYIMSHVKIPVYVLIRPRNGDFLYSRAEFEIIKSDIFSAKVAGASGIVVGMLNSDGTVDTCRMKEVIQMCHPLPVTFHRAFDMVVDPFDALEKIINLGCSRILTSGLQTTASAGSALISKLNESAAGRIIIMPGSGINEKNFLELLEVTGCIEFHLSASTDSQSKMKYQNTILSHVFSPTYKTASQYKIEEICRLAGFYNV